MRQKDGGRNKRLFFETPVGHTARAAAAGAGAPLRPALCQNKIIREPATGTEWLLMATGGAPGGCIEWVTCTVRFGLCRWCRVVAFVGAGCLLPSLCRSARVACRVAGCVGSSRSVVCRACSWCIKKVWRVSRLDTVPQATCAIVAHETGRAFRVFTVTAGDNEEKDIVQLRRLRTSYNLRWKEERKLGSGGERLRSGCGEVRRAGRGAAGVGRLNGCCSGRRYRLCRRSAWCLGRCRDGAVRSCESYRRGARACPSRGVG
eukprot:gene23179-biopygen2818